jgi:hypothetical protein
VVAALSAGVLGTLLSGAPVTTGATGPVRLAALETTAQESALTGPAPTAGPACAGSICITRVGVRINPSTKVTDMLVNWKGSSERYNIEVSAPGIATVKSYDNPAGTGNASSIGVPAAVWGKTVSINVEGCNDGGVFSSSDCTGWAHQQITLHAPAAPGSVRRDGDVVSWSKMDDLTTYGYLRGRAHGEWTDLAGTLEDHTRNKLPYDWRDYDRIELCADNPAGASCTLVPGEVPAPAPQPTPKPLPAKPTAPTRFQAAHQNGFGTTVQLSWADTTDETYYYLTASSVNGDVPQRLPAPAPKLGQNSTGFLVTGDLTALVGGVRFRLQACNEGGCSEQVTATVN